MLDVSLPESERALLALRALATLAEQRGRPGDLLPRLLADLKDACGADGLGFERREGDETIFEATTGSFHALAGARGSMAGSLGGAAILSRNVALSPDSLDDARIDRAICLRGDVASMVAVPVDVSGLPAGALVAAWRQPNGYSDTAVMVLRIAAGLIGGLLGRTLHADRADDPMQLLASAFSQTQHRDVEQRTQGERDTLTGLIKVQPFATALSASIAHWSPAQGSAVLFIDLDRFHRVNEQHGHSAGDAVLQRLADVLRRCTRGHDVVSRLGDDDFAVLLNRLSNPALQAAVAAERIIDTVMADNLTNDTLPRIQVCIGAALIDRAGMNAERVMREAEDALHAEKSEKR